MVTISLIRIEAYEIAFMISLASDSPRFNYSNAKTSLSILQKIKKQLKKHADKAYIQMKIEKLYGKYHDLAPKKRGGK